MVAPHLATIEGRGTADRGTARVDPLGDTPGVRRDHRPRHRGLARGRPAHRRAGEI